MNVDNWNVKKPKMCFHLNSTKLVRFSVAKILRFGWTGKCASAEENKCKHDHHSGDHCLGPTKCIRCLQIHIDCSCYGFTAARRLNDNNHFRDAEYAIELSNWILWPKIRREREDDWERLQVASNRRNDPDEARRVKEHRKRREKTQLHPAK